MSAATDSPYSGANALTYTSPATFGSLPAGQWLLTTGDHGVHLFVVP